MVANLIARMSDAVKCPPHRNCPAGPLESVLEWAAGVITPARPSHKLESSGSASRSWSNLASRSSSDLAPAMPKVDLRLLNPSLFVVGLELVEALYPRYRPKAGVACERMQHAGLPVDMIRKLLEAVFVCPPGATEQSEEALREVFQVFDTSGDGTLDADDFLATLPLLGETVPPEVLDRLFAKVDMDAGGTVDAAEYVRFLRAINPLDEDSPDGWRVFFPGASAHFEEMVLLQVGEGRARRKWGGASEDEGPNGAWRLIPPEEMEFAQRSSSAPWSTSVLIPRADLTNAEAVIKGLKELGFRVEQVHTVTRALFVTQSDEDFARVFEIFDKDGTGGIDPFEFRATVSLLGDHLTEDEARELFLEMDKNNDGVLDASEFTDLLRQISSKARAAADTHIMRITIARERLQRHLSSVSAEHTDPATADGLMQVLVLGPTQSGKTYLLNQVLADKLPKGATFSVGVGALPMRFGTQQLVVQVLDTPGDPRFAPLAKIFYASTPYLLLMYDATSYESFEALQPLFDGFLAANPHCVPAQHVCLVANEARLGMRHAVSFGFALEWCEANGDIPLFEIDPEVPQAILEPLRHLADEYITANPIPRDDALKPGGGGGGGGGGDRSGERRADQVVGRRRADDQQTVPAPWEGGGGTAGGGAARPLQRGANQSFSSSRRRRSRDQRAPGVMQKVGWADM